MPLDRRLLASGMLAFAAVGMTPALYGVGIPVWSDRFGLAAGEGGAALAAHGAGALASILAGLLGLPGLTLGPGLAVMGAGAALLGWAPSWGAALLGALVVGLGFGIVVTVVNRRFLHDFGPRGPGMVGLVNAVTGLGAIAAPLLVVAAGGRPGPVLLALAALCALTLPLVAPEARRAPSGLPPLRDPSLLLLLFVAGAVAIEVAMTGFGVSALIDLGATGTRAARLASGFFAAFLLVRVGLFWAAGRLPPATLFALGLAGTALCAGLAAFGVAPGAAYVAAGATVGVCWPSFYVWASRRLGGDPRLGAAVLAASQIGAILGPLALRPTLARTGDDGLFGAVAMTSLVLLLLFLPVMARPSRRSPIRPRT